jgi:hypothetical protein
MMYAHAYRSQRTEDPNPFNDPPPTDDPMPIDDPESDVPIEEPSRKPPAKQL